MQTTKFLDTPTKGRLLKTQAAIYGVTGLLSVALLASDGWLWWQARHPHQAAATSAPVIQPAQVAQVQQPTATPEDAGTPPPNNHRHIAPGDIAGTDPDARFSPPIAQPTPTPWQPPVLDMNAVTAAMQRTAPGATTPTPDPVAARHARWQSLHDGYVMQVRARLAEAKTDEQKGQIQRDIALWQRTNPEPPKPTTGDEIPIR